MRQKELYSKYPDPTLFFSDYNPDLQVKVIKSNATHADLAMNQNIPTLGLLEGTYGCETPVEWLKIQFGSLNDYAEQGKDLLPVQLEELAELVLAEYYYLNVAEICFFIARLKLGKYGQFYGAVGPMKIAGSLVSFVGERRIDIERLERERKRMQSELDKAEVHANAMTREQYLELKKRASDGDEEAIEKLKPPIKR